MREKILGLIKETPEGEDVKFDNIFFVDNQKDFENIFTEDKIKRKFKLDNIKTIKAIFKHKKYFHNLLYDKEIIIDIKFNEKNLNLCFLFYLYLLIKDMEHMINYHYDWEEIRKVNKLISIFDDKITKIVLAKIVNYLIDNYKGLDNNTEKMYKIHLLRIELDNINIIKNNIEYLKPLKLNWSVDDINQKNIDEMYIEIFIALFKQNLLGNNEYIDLFKNLDFELIDFSEEMLKKVSNFLKNKEINLINYIIKKDTNKIKKNIKFYYYLFKYILKDSLHLHEYSFYLNNKFQLLKLIKNEENIFIPDLDKSLKIEYEYVLKAFLDSKYYEKKFYKNYKSNKIEKEQLEQNLKEKSNQKNKKSKKKKPKKENINDCYCNVIHFKKELKKYEDSTISIDKQKYIPLIGATIINEIQINEEIIAFTSNSLYSHGKDIIVFYNTKTNAIQKIIEGYPFSKNSKSWDFIDIRSKKYLIIICGIISANQKNGILLIDLDILNNIDNENDEEFTKFFETEIGFFYESVSHLHNPEAKNEDKNNLNITNSNSNIIYNEEYILVGGLDQEKSEGVVKLFRIKIEDKISLQFLDDIIICDKYDKDCQKIFSGSVSFIKQEDDGEIKFRFIETFDTIDNIYTIYVCEKPQLEYYIKD